MKLTKEIFEQAKSVNGAWSANQLRLLTNDTLFKKGWKRKITGKDYPVEIINEFIALKDKHLTLKQIEDRKQIELEKLTPVSLFGEPI